MPDKKAVFTRIVLTLGADPSLIVEGSFSQADLDPLIDRWVGLLGVGSGSADPKLDQILAQNEASKRLLEQLMVDFTNASAVLDAVKATTDSMAVVVDEVIATDATEDAAFQAEIDRLKAIIDGGDAVTQAQLDALAAGFSEPNDKLIALREALKAMGPGNVEPTLPAAGAKKRK